MPNGTTAEVAVLNSSVRPHMDQSTPISSVDLVALFVIKEGGDIVQGFCNRAPNSRRLDSL